MDITIFNLKIVKTRLIVAEIEFIYTIFTKLNNFKMCKYEKNSLNLEKKKTVKERFRWKFIYMKWMSLIRHSSPVWNQEFFISGAEFNNVCKLIKLLLDIQRRI